MNRSFLFAIGLLLVLPVMTAKVYIIENRFVTTGSGGATINATTSSDFIMEVYGNGNITGDLWVNNSQVCTASNGLCAGGGGGSGYTQFRLAAGNSSGTQAITNNTLVNITAAESGGITVTRSGGTIIINTSGGSGSQGPAGTAGLNGTNGLNGTGILFIYLVTNGSLQINLTNGTNITTGNLSGATGAQGATGNTGSTGPTGPGGINGTNGLNGSNASVTSGDNYINITSGVVTANTTHFDLRYYLLATNPLGYYNVSTIPAFLLSSVAATTYYPLATNPLGYYNTSTLPSPLDHYQWRIAINGGTPSAVTNNTLVKFLPGAGISLMNDTTNNITITSIITQYTDSLADAALQNSTILRNSTIVNFTKLQINSSPFLSYNGSCFNISGATSQWLVC